MVNTTYNSTEDINNKLQQLKGKTKLKFYKNINNYYTEMKNKNFQTQQDPFAKIAQSISKIYHEVLCLWNFHRPSHRLKIWILNIMSYITLLLKVEKNFQMIMRMIILVLMIL